MKKVIVFYLRKLNCHADAKQRLKIMCATNDGFKIAEKDLEIRGPGDIEGTRQSGILTLSLPILLKIKKFLKQPG